MGMRQNVKMTYENGASVYVYSHWTGDEDRNKSPLAEKVRTALNRKQRWDDESYLARIIVSEIIDEEHGNDGTGYGISPYEIDPEFQTIEVDLSKKTVNEIAFSKWVTL